MAKYGLLVVLAALFAMNMGGGNFAASFAAAHGGKVITKRWAHILFAVFVFLGAVLVGRPVAHTLGDKLVPHSILSLENLLVILIAGTVSLLLANLLHVPQSTSWVTVAAISGVGLYFQSLQKETFLCLLPFWVGLPLAGYLLTYFLGRLVYPPHRGNFWIHERLVNHNDRLRVFVIIASCYNAFSVGANNVANAVGPLAGGGIIGVTAGLALAAPLFGVGSLLFAGPLKTTSQQIVPLGLLTATIICLVSGTLMIIASLLGVPQSFVMIKVASVFAVGGLKDGHKTTFTNPATMRTYSAWAITPLIALALSFLLTWGRYAIFK